MEHFNDNYDRSVFSLINTVSSIAVLIGKFFRIMGHLLKEMLSEQVILDIFSFIVSCCLVQEISYSFELKHDFFTGNFRIMLQQNVKVSV